MNAVAQKASVKAQELREKQGVNRPVRATYIPKPRTDRKFKCVDGEMFRLSEATGKYEKYDYMENIPGTTLKF